MSETAAPAFTVVVITYNSAHVVGELLDSLPAAVDHVPIEAIVVDNGSTDGTADLVEARGDCVVVRSTNLGYAAGINRGYETGRGRGPVLILNPDVRLHPGSVTRMAEALQRPNAGIVAPPRLERRWFAAVLAPSRADVAPRAIGLTFTRVPKLSEYCNRPDDYLSTRVVDWALGAVMLVRRECFAALDGWDASYFLYSEETDFCLRARGARLVHLVRAVCGRRARRAGVGVQQGHPPRCRSSTASASTAADTVS